MHKLFRSMGRLTPLEDARGTPVSGLLAEGQPVLADVWYELTPSPQQPLRVDMYGPGLFGLGQTRDRLTLDNGVVLTGRSYGGGFGARSAEPRRMRLVDVEERKIELHPTDAGSSYSDIDAAVLGVLSTRPLGHGACTNGVARPGFPFSFRTKFPKTLNRAKWSTQALQLHRDGLEITFSGTSGYWLSMVNRDSLQHDAIVGVRRSNSSVLKWDELNSVVALLSDFLGWINHCNSPVFHIKAYRKGKLVYRGYDLYPHPTVRRDAVSWLPMFGQKEQKRALAEDVQGLLDAFARVWTRNEEEGGVFHIALEMLRSRSKGSPRHNAAIGYLRDTFSACGILVSILIGANSHRSRHDVIWNCLREIGVEDKLPLGNRDERDYILENHAELWWGVRRGEVLEEDKGTLSRPLANVQNWLLHIDDPKNADMLLRLPSSIQQYLVEVSTWLADLMILKIVGYRGQYINRLTGQAEFVPWANR